MDKIITHEECVGFDASFGACFVDDYTFCIRAGNFLQINRFKDRAIDQLGIINGELTGFSAMAGDPLNKILAYADTVRNPMIHFVDTSGVETGTLTIGNILGIKSLGFSYDGQWLYSLGGLPTFRLSAIDMKTREEVCSKTFDLPIGEHISICPTKSRVVAVYGDSVLNIPKLPDELLDEKPPHLRFFTLLGASNQYIFSEVTCDVPDPVISICWSPHEECVVGTTTGMIYFIDPTTGQLTREPYSMSYLGEGEQNATAIYCTSKYMITSGSTGNLYWIELDDLEKKEDLFILDTRSSLIFANILPGTNSLFFASEKNMLSCIDLDQETHKYVDETWINLRDTHRGPITSCVALPHSLVTAGRDGTLRFYSFSPFLGLTQNFSFGSDPLTALAASGGGYLVAVGSESGMVRIINTVDSSTPILLYRERLHKGPVSAITISREYIASASSDGSVVILQSDPKAMFPIIGQLKLKSGIVSLASPAPLGNNQQLLIATRHREVIRIDIPNEPADNFQLNVDNLNRAMLKVSNKITGICSEPSLREDQQYFYCACDDKTVKYYCMPITTGDLDVVGVDDVEASAPDDVLGGHAKAVSAVSLSPNQSYVASGCAGASLIVREVDVQTAQVLNTILTVTHHDPLNGAISSITFSPDGKKIFTVGYDGCINMYSMKIQSCPIPADQYEMPQGCLKISVSRVFLIEQQISNLIEVWQKREYDAGDEDGFQADDGPGYEELALCDQIKAEEEKIQKEETEKFQKEIMNELQQIQSEFTTLINENENASELEKLNKSDFTLDVATSEKLQQVAQIKSQLVHYRRRVKNQIRSLIAQSITTKCFQPFEPKLTSIYAFKVPISFDNFPLPIPNEKRKRLAQCITLLRRTEIAALRYKPSPTDPNRIAPSMMRDNNLDGARYLSSRSNSLVQLTATESEQEIVVKDDLKLLYDPFQIVTANRKITQLTVIQNLIFEEMNKFNITFEELLAKKQNLVQSLEEKNKRIRQLIRILKLNEADYVIFDPVPEENEVAENFLTVKDEEVILKKQLDQQKNTQDTSDELEKDSFAERALRQMMGGNVNMNNMDEVPMNDDEPERPEWMDQKKKEDLTEEEQYQIQEFDKKLKNFIEEREKRRKALNAELTKLVKGNASSIEEFDRQMCATYMIRFDCEERVFYHELEIMHLVEALNEERKERKELKCISEESLRKVTEQRQKQPLHTELNNVNNQLHDDATTAEQNLENLKSQVNKEFHNRDCVNQLMRLYNSVSKRIRPQIESGPNPFRQYLSHPYVFKDDLTDVHNSRPASLADAPWKNFLEYCERKIVYSRDAAEKVNMSTEMKSRVKVFDNELESIDESLKEMKDRQSKLTDKLLHTLVDMHIPFTFRQGQVEIPSDIVLIDYSDVVLIDRKVVMDRNRLILDAGQRKLDELENIKKQHTNHKMLKWEIDKCRVDLQNLEEQFKEYQLFRVTKDDMNLIKGSDKNNNQVTVNQLNKGLEHMQRTHVVRLARAKQDLKKLKRRVSRKKTENDRIEDEILQMQLGLKERKRIYNIQMISTKGAAEARKNRLKQVMMISRLKRAKQVQEQKIAALKEDVIRLRRCVYTSFNDGEDFDTMVGYNA
ncbi:hypothetical protein TRFO_33196 [Tritrichomonas foetus]|uniref:Cilia- and flagella-associated protein 43 n=1 Tax=Tritrichomonas foetus TaxID=1144522 RepID=A0A1J4JRM0_9EUKA|nr:hypothetical protein TRFO_33196 [Tritrichomonas foetus]|eukprot:OHT00172.1 hypothetical protein TRFO_33196 [Tritrichomonas foetus]